MPLKEIEYIYNIFVASVELLFQTFSPIIKFSFCHVSIRLVENMEKPLNILYFIRNFNIL